MKWGIDGKRRANELELLSQAVYDMRDSTPANDEATWQKLDRIAKTLGKLGAKLRPKQTPRGEM